MPAPVLEPALDPVLDHERAHLAAARAQLARMRDSAASLDASRASDAVSGEALGATLARRVAALTDDPWLADDIRELLVDAGIRATHAVLPDGRVVVLVFAEEVEEARRLVGDSPVL